jgi:hypothetical protein
LPQSAPRFWRAVVVLCVGWPSVTLLAQPSADCRLFCTPELLIEPTWTIEALAGRPRVGDGDGREERLQPGRVFELVLAVDVPTRVSRVGVTGEAIWSPFADDNAVELEFELNLDVIRKEHTGNWLSSHFDIVDQFSPAERPTDRAAYTHKLDFELDTALALFTRLPQGSWLRSLEIEGSLDYLASGLPRRGDVVDGIRYLDRASPWSFSVVLAIPVAPR